MIAISRSRALAVVGTLGFAFIVPACSSRDTDTASQTVEQRDISNVGSMQSCPPDNTDPKCPAGDFAVICLDGSREVDTQQQILENQICLPHGPYFLSGPGGEALYVDDDVVVSVNGTQVYGDLGRGAGNRAPITVNARPGDSVQVSFFDTYGQSRGHAEVWLSGPAVALQRVLAGFAGGPGETYAAETKQPFDIVAFQVPGPGQTATPECLPEVSLDTSWWKPSANLVIHTATTKGYAVTWTVSQHDYTYTPDCSGWVGDVFIASDGAWASVQWNTITNQLRTSAVAGHPYGDGIARSAAEWAVSTLFPAGDMGLLAIQ